MGWFGDWWYRDDPRKAVEIDKNLQEFLQRERPRVYQPVADSPNPETSKAGTFQSQQHRPSPITSPDPKTHASQSTDQDATQVPPESLFQDGRYKHLWSTYRPQKEIEAAAKTDQDRMSDIARGWKQRTADIGRAATENCAEESLAVHNCFRNGDWKSKMTMCREQNKALSRCVTMQREFLNALGYMTIWDRTPEEAERLQVHADQLYRQMLEHEKVLAEAKEKGQPAPSLPPILDDKGTEKKIGYKFKWDELPEEFRQKVLEGRLKGLEGPALEVGKKAVVSDVERTADAVWQTNDHYELERRHRIERYWQGTETFGDRLRRWWDAGYGDRSFPAKPEPGTVDGEQK